MKPQQIKLRIKALILKDEQMIRGYGLANRNLSVVKYNKIIGKIRKSRERKLEALESLNFIPTKDYKWGEVCSRFGFSGYKQ